MDTIESRLLTNHDTIITDITYTIDKFGIIKPSIKIDPPIEIGVIFQDSGKKHIFNQSLIHTDFRSFNNPENTGINSKIKIFKNIVKNQDLSANNLISDISIELCEDTPKFDKPLLIDKCPICNSQLKNYNGIYICNNAKCKTQIFGKCHHFLRHMGIRLHGIYFQIFCTLIARGIIEDQSDIFKIFEKEVFESIDTIKNTQREIYYKLIYDSIQPKVNMIKFLKALNIIPNIEESDGIEKFVKNIQENYNEATITNIYLFIENIINDFAIIIDENTDDTISVFDQLTKLSHDDINKLSEKFGNIQLYEIASIIDYIWNTNNKNMLNKFNIYFSTPMDDILKKIYA